MIKTFSKSKSKSGSYLAISVNKPAKKIVDQAVAILRAGGVIIYPTDTLYGFGALVDQREAIERIFTIKKRDMGKPFSILINNRAQAERIVGKMTRRERLIFDLLMPGKVTLLIETRRKIEIPGLDNLDKIGFRIPDSLFCRELVSACGIPLTSSSVNISSERNLGKMADIRLEFGRKVDLILDGGPLTSLKGSSVLDISSQPPVLIREGEISMTDLEKKLGFPVRRAAARKFVISFICSGNICRSPMAEGVMKKRLDKEIFNGKVEVNSAGTLNIPSSAASLLSIKVAADQNIDISTHLSRHVDSLFIDQADLIFCLAENHFTYLRENFPDKKDKIHLLKGYENEGLIGDASIADPIGQSEEFYRQIYTEIETEIDRILPSVMKKILKYIYNI